MAMSATDTEPVLAEQLMRQELEEAGLGELLHAGGGDDLAASLALAMELQREEEELLEEEGEGPDVDNMTYEELLALGEESERSEGGRTTNPRSTLRARATQQRSLLSVP